MCVIGPQVVDAMSDSTASSTTANDLDLIYLKGIMESPVVFKRNRHVHMSHARMWTYVSGFVSSP